MTKIATFQALWFPLNHRPVLIFDGPPVGSGIFESLHHHIHLDFAGIVDYGIDLLGTLETTCNRLHTRQPFQGCFAYVVSSNIKYGF